MIFSFVRAAALAAAMSLTSAALLAQNVAYNPEQKVDSFSLAVLMPILAEQGSTITNRWTTSAGGKTISAKMKNGVVVNIRFAACNESNKNCVGMSMVSSWAVPEQWSQADKLLFANTFSNKYAFIKASVSEPGKLYLLRYTIADYGTFAGNIAAELANFERISTKYQTAMIAKDNELASK